MAFDFYFAGAANKEAEELMISENANILRSYMTEKSSIEKLCQAKRDGWQGKLLVDNGAFTVHRKGGVLDIDVYIDYINSHDEADYFIALDDIPGKWGQPKTAEDVANSPKITWENYLYMIEKVNKPEKLLPVFHQGENIEYLEQILKHPTPKYICLSGNKEYSNKTREEWYTICYQVINELNPNIKVHCLGSATVSNVEKWPFTSMDSTTWIMVGANGSIIGPNSKTVYVGDGGKSLSEAEREELDKYVSQWGFKLEDLGEDTKARMLINYHNIFNMSKTVNYEPVKKKVRTLF